GAGGLERVAVEDEVAVEQKARAALLGEAGDVVVEGGGIVGLGRECGAAAHGLGAVAGIFEAAGEGCRRRQQRGEATAQKCEPLGLAAQSPVHAPSARRYARK